ncbi:NAD-dependent epimerase/dehydratase family protein [Kutzneria buriramensis]|uniref:Nucleoside-diphosphate-sugar epimerase n=1 Tax=Kutzneria buriramensis TaxID=1045776 RepID=A0A3E0I967_9PSEU|nr:NAD-dependent epimerase/dehydratase family protein [Kutzneria buriramensis]REH55086.1 nucleoside-diphosphate-sugar epimerase [Kutzneria buriramensis]
MRLLVLGGTVFLGHTVAAEALRRGHEVVCAARGTGGDVPAGAKLVRLDRSDPDGLEPLKDERFDAVVDVATISYPWVRDAVRALGPNAGHWTFVSSISAYASFEEQGQNEDSTLLAPRREDGTKPDADPGLYGAVKVASENEVLEHLADRAFVVRSGLITGPKDPSDRFGYWPGRFARGGRVLLPPVDGQMTQHVDVRDLAKWIIDAGEQRITGVYNATGISRPLGGLLDEIREILAPAGTETVTVSEELLRDNDVQYWGGPKSLPLWLPPKHMGFTTHDVSKAIAAGLTFRPFEDAVRGALARETELGFDRERRSGLTPAQEREVLDKLQA